jgi:hypothetical protein
MLTVLRRLFAVSEFTGSFCDCFNALLRIAKSEFLVNDIICATQIVVLYVPEPIAVEFRTLVLIEPNVASSRTRFTTATSGCSRY